MEIKLAEKRYEPLDHSRIQKMILVNFKTLTLKEC